MAQAPWEHSLEEWMLNAGADLIREPDALPVTMTLEKGPKAKCYITSPKIAWFDYAADELRGQFFLSFALKTLAHLADGLGLGQNIIVGNFPISTNVWSNDQSASIFKACQSECHKNTERFIFVRNLLFYQHEQLITNLQSIGFVLLPARVIYEFDLRQGMKSKPSHLMRDLSALKKSTLQVNYLEHIDDQIANHFQHLYDLIYIQKHSAYNAKYTPAFFKDMINSKWMKALSLQNETGEIIAFALLHQIGDTLTVPALGYIENESGPGTYRLLFASLYKHTVDHQLMLNYSSGAGDFKRKRGAQSRLEYTAVKAPNSFLNWKARLMQWVAGKTKHMSEQDLIQRGA